jgi:uncharacterized membrane protein
VVVDMGSPTPQPPPVGATVHVYRALMDRVSMWRNRIDIPTNWAVVTSGTAASFALSDPNHSHTVLLLVMLLTCSFWFIEARRYRYYDLWGGWLRLLESDYYGTILQENRVALSQIWQQLVVRDMHYPHYKTTFLESLGRRLRNNYLAIFLFLLLAWLLKLTIHPRPDLPPIDAVTWINHASVALIPGPWVTSGVIGFYIVLVLIALFTRGSNDTVVEVLPYNKVLQKLAVPSQKPVSDRMRAGAPRRTYDRAPWDNTID